MKVLQVPILFCFRCKELFTPNTDPDEECIFIPKACPKRNCRSQTWNIPDDELEIIKQTQRNNLLLVAGRYTGIKKSVPVLDKYKPKKQDKKPLIICQECEIFYFDKSSLQRHQTRRHHGMCMVCHTSNVYVMIRDGITICKNCFESKKQIPNN